MIRILQVGLGPLGQKIVQFAAERKSLQIVGAVDTDPAKIGQPLGALCRLKGKLPIPIAPDVSSALKKTKADLAVLATVSSIEKLLPQVKALAEAGLDIVSTCEELSFPWNLHAAAAAQIDRLCRQHAVTCVGTGVNPGYLMDYLPIVLSAPCQRVDHIEVLRFQDAARRRGPFQKKIGAGLSPRDFKQKVAQGVIRHVGLPESVQMLAHAMGWALEKQTETIRPVIATRACRTRHVTVKAGQVAGIEQIARGIAGGNDRIRLHFRAAVGQSGSCDTVRLRGLPSFESHIPGGINGDVATCAITLNTLTAVQAAAPGLKTMPELQAPCWTQRASPNVL